MYSTMYFSVKYLCNLFNYNYTCSSRITLSLTPTLKTLAVGTISSHLTSTSRFLSPSPYLSPCLLSSEGNSSPKNIPNLTKRRVSTILCLALLFTLSSLALGLAIYLLITGGLGNNPVYSKSQFGFAVMQISLGYFLADFIVCLLDKNLRQDFGSLAHHVAGIIGIALGLFYQGGFMFFILFCLLSELSTPLVNLFWILTMLDRRDSPLFAVTSWGMLITFFLCRLEPEYWIWNILLTALFHPASVIIPLPVYVWVFVNYIAFDILNIFWFWKMLKGAAKQIRKLAKRS